MIKKCGFIFLISVLLCILQQGLFSRMKVLNVGFDAVYVFVLCFALLNNEIESLLFAFFCGLLRDSFFPYVFGINTVLYIISVFLIIQINKRVFKDTLIIQASLTFAFSIFKGLIYFAYFYIASIRFDNLEKTINVILLEALYNSIVSIIVYGFIKRINKLKIMQREWKF